MALNSIVNLTYKVNGLGTDLLFKALEDPTIQVPGVDAKIPMMEKTKNMEIGFGDNRKIEYKNSHWFRFTLVCCCFIFWWFEDKNYF